MSLRNIKMAPLCKLCKYRFDWSGKWKPEMESTHPCNKQTNMIRKSQDFFGGFLLFGPLVRQCHGVVVQAHHASCTNARRTQGQGGISPNTPRRRRRRRWPCAQPSLRCAAPTAGNAPYCHSTPWLASFVARRPLRPLPCRKGSYLSPCRLD